MIEEKKYAEVPWDIVLDEEAFERQTKSGPTPYIKSYSWTGQLKVGWSTDLVPY
jgi:hypothetical protein